MPGYHQRQTCPNGHVTSNYVGTPHGNAHMQTFCDECGAQTIVNCPSCRSPQRGSIRDVLSAGKPVPDAYCWNCGKPYPWTELQTEAALEMIQEEQDLNESDKAVLSAALPDLISETPRTALAATRFKRIVSSAGPTFRAATYKFIVDVSSETAKKIILGG